MTRERYIADLRMLADLLEQNPNLPLPDSGPVPVVIQIDDIKLQPDEVRALLEALSLFVPEGVS